MSISTPSLARTPAQRVPERSSWPQPQTIHNYQPPRRLDYRARHRLQLILLATFCLFKPLLHKYSLPATLPPCYTIYSSSYKYFPHANSKLPANSLHKSLHYVYKNRIDLRTAFDTFDKNPLGTNGCLKYGKLGTSWFLWSMVLVSNLGTIWDQWPMFHF